jgi:hypothetical protein
LHNEKNYIIFEVTKTKQMIITFLNPKLDLGVLVNGRLAGYIRAPRNVEKPINCKKRLDTLILEDIGADSMKVVKYSIDTIDCTTMTDEIEFEVKLVHTVDSSDKCTHTVTVWPIAGY